VDRRRDVHWKTVLAGTSKTTAENFPRGSVTVPFFFGKKEEK
jgi:hypothetical protein